MSPGDMYLFPYVSRDMKFKMSLPGLKLSVGLHSFQGFRELCPSENFVLSGFLSGFIYSSTTASSLKAATWASIVPVGLHPSPTVESPLSVLLLHTAISLRSLVVLLASPEHCPIKDTWRCHTCSSLLPPKVMSTASEELDVDSYEVKGAIVLTPPSVLYLLCQWCPDTFASFLFPRTVCRALGL